MSRLEITSVVDSFATKGTERYIINQSQASIPFCSANEKVLVDDSTDLHYYLLGASTCINKIYYHQDYKRPDWPSKCKLETRAFSKDSTDLQYYFLGACTCVNKIYYTKTGRPNVN